MDARRLLRRLTRLLRSVAGGVAGALTPGTRQLEGALRRAPGLRVRHPRTLRDQGVARRVATALRGHGGVQAYVYAGRVALHGTVADEAARERVVARARGVPGVRGVEDHLTVEAPRGA